MFSLATEPMFDPPRPPVPMIARLSFSLRFRPRTIAGAAKVEAATTAVVWRKCRRVVRRIVRMIKLLCPMPGLNAGKLPYAHEYTAPQRQKLPSPSVLRGRGAGGEGLLWIHREDASR